METLTEFSAKVMKDEETEKLSEEYRCQEGAYKASDLLVALNLVD